jgi:hypothetical protein
MSLIDKIIQVGVERGVKEAQLYPAAQACYEDPTRGITVQNKYAPMVIRDCAFVAKQYIPTLVVNEVSDMVKQLRTKGITEAEITDFITVMNQAENPASKGYTEVFLSLCDKGAAYLVVDDGTTPVEIVTEPEDYTNVYGDYATSVHEEDVHTCSEFVGTDTDKLVAILIP